MNTFHDLNRRMEAAVHPDADMEVPHMTSDIYYGFDSRAFYDSLEKPQAPVRGRQFRSTYAMADGGLAIANGPGFFNRPLYTPGCRTLLNAGDRPALLLWTIADYPKPGNPGWGLPDYLGRLFVGLSHGGTSKWLHDFADCRTLYHPGWVEYRLEDPAFPGLTAQVEILPHASGAVWVEVAATLPPNATEDPALVWTHGCIGFASTDRSQHYDAGCGEAVRKRLDWDEPHLAENDTVLPWGQPLRIKIASVG